MFARAATRENEIVVRSALGASRGRIVTQLLAEALVLGGVAVVVGVAAARLLLQWRLRVSAIDADGRLPFWFTDSLTLTTVLYACALTVLSAVVAGVVPALKATARRLEPQLRQIGARATLRIGGIWTAVIVTQVAITVAFPAATFFVQRNVAQKQSLDVGFPAAEYLSGRLEIDAENPARNLASTWEELERRLSSQADVAGVAFTDRLPRTVHAHEWVEIESVDTTAPTTARVNVASVSANYFAVLDAPMLSGRAFQPADRAPDARSVIVNADFVRTVLGGRNPVGRRVRDLPGNPNRPIPPGHTPGPWYEIVGVARNLGMIHDDPRQLAGLYRPLPLERAHSVHIAVHVKGDPAAFRASASYASRDRGFDAAAV